MTGARLNLALGAATLAAILAACLLGPTPLGPGEVAAAMFGAGDEATAIVVQSIRLPRAIAAFIVGGALGISGAALQGLLRNPLAEPGVLGVSVSAVFGATLTIYYGLAAVSALAVPLAAIAGALLATALIAIAAIRVRSVVTLILIGVGLSSFIGALMSLLLSLAPNPFTMAEMINWTFGSVANRSWADLAFAAPIVAGGSAILLATARGSSALMLGEEAAAGAGLGLARHRLLTVLGTGIATGAAVAVAGAIGFIGIVAPHLVRPLTGHDPGRSLVPSFLLGGLILVLADIAIRLLPTSGEMRLGVVAALIGAPVFALIAAQRRGIR